MDIRIYKGTQEIGGTALEVKTKNTTILIDYGLPLKGDSPIVDLSEMKYDAVLLSHSHQDHHGLIERLDHHIPVYGTELMFSLINTLNLFTRRDLLKNTQKHFHAWQEFKIGDILVTAYLMDHSAPDSFAFLLEAEGKRIFYSGDFRGHGRKSKVFDNIRTNPPKDIELLFLEGTMMGRQDDQEKTEDSVKDEMISVLKNSESLSFLICSSQNIDRIVSAYKASVTSKRVFIVDIYTAWILKLMKKVSKSMPYLDWDNVKVLSKGRFASYYYGIVKENPQFFGDFITDLYDRDAMLSHDEVLNNPKKYYIKVSDRFVVDFIQLLDNRPTIIYSMWEGYLSNIYNPESSERFNHIRSSTDFHVVHTSGHAYVRELKDFVDALKPNRVVPVHTECADEYEKIFSNTHVLQDGKTISI
jgi:ribonuclease J